MKKRSKLQGFFIFSLCFIFLMLSSKTAISYTDSINITKEEREFLKILHKNHRNDRRASDSDINAFLEAMSHYVNSVDMKVLTELVSEDALDERILRSFTRDALMKIPEIKSLAGYFQRNLNEILLGAARMEDRFPETIKTIEIPSYNLAEDFPKEHIKTFNDFLIFCASLKEGRENLIGRICELPIVKTRLEMNNPVQYEDFLSAVTMSISLFGWKNTPLNIEWRTIATTLYVQKFMYASRNSFFIDNIVEPLSNDLKNAEYRGFYFKSDNIPQFFRDFVEKCYIMRWREFRNFTDIVGIYSDPNTEKLCIPEDIYFLNYYVNTFWLIHQGKLREAYTGLYRYIARAQLPPRPYYFYSDENRYLWFEYMQSELISMGHTAFADEILKTELEHYRELINWQLQLRAYLTNKLYEYGDNANLSTLYELLTLEYNDLKNDPITQTKYEKAIEILRNIDAKVLNTPVDTSKGEMTLQWIDRKEIDNKQGIGSVILSVNPQPITWRTAIENIDVQTKDEMEKSYRSSIFYIRALAVMCENLYLEIDLRTMVQLHSKLVNNKNISYTPTGASFQDFSTLKNTYGDGADYPDLDTQTKLNLRRFDLIANDFWGHQARRRNGDMTVGEIILPWVEVQDINP